MENYAQLPDGRLMMADGLNPVKTWDGLAPAPQDAGIAAPTSAVTATPVAASHGPILGTYGAYARFVDALGQVGNFGPVAVQITAHAGVSKAISAMSQAQPCVLTFTAAHGLASGDLIIITGATAPTELNNTWIVTVIDLTRVSIALDSTGLDALAGAAVADTGIGQINYTGIPVSSSPRVKQVQVLRNTDGQMTTFYVDVTVANGTTTASSTNSDVQLGANIAVPIVNDDGSLNAFAHGVPPAWKTVLAHHLDRAFAAVDAVVTDGSVVVVNGSAIVQGIGTHWTAQLAGRWLYVNGATQPYPISSVNVGLQQLTLSTNYADSSAPYASYAVKPPTAERRTVYYTLAGQPESWPATNALTLQEDGDEITGLMVKGSFIYILEQRHIYRFTFQTDPATDGFVFLSVERGCINQRCWVQAEDKAFMLDYSGIHAYDGSEAKPISEAIQRLFQPGETPLSINWAASEQFHACLDPHGEIVRWFVCVGSSYLPRHAICFHYRLERWWMEEYPYPIGASTTGFWRNARQPFAGSTPTRIFLLDRGKLDAIDPGACTTAGAVASATGYTLTDTAAAFTSAAVGVPVTISKGKGRGQRRIVTAVSANGLTLTVKNPWRLQPDATSRYKLGGIPWYWKTGTYHFATQSENEQNRRVGVYFDPTVRYEGWVALRIFFDRDTQAQVFGHTVAGRDNEGFEADRGVADLVLDLTRPDGYVQQRLDNHRESNLAGTRDLRLEFDGCANEQLTVITEVQIEGVNPRKAGGGGN